MAFHASYTVPETQAQIVQAFRRRGLRRSLSHDKSCIVQWAPFSKTAWNKALNDRMIVGNFFVHAGLCSKHLLFRTLQEAAAVRSELALLLPVTYCVDSSIGVAEPKESSDHSAASTFSDVTGTVRLEVVLDHIFPPKNDAQICSAKDVAKPRASGARPERVWVIKGSTSNNACEVFVVACRSDALAVLTSLSRDRLPPPTITHSQLGDIAPEHRTSVSSVTVGPRPSQEQQSWVVQEYIAKPLLLHGRFKFHIRCNVLVLGCAEIFVHRNYICHAATEPFRLADFSNRWIHITNHGTQQQHSAFDASRQTLPRQRFLDAIAAQNTVRGIDNGAWDCALWSALKSASRSVILACMQRRKLFLPMPNMFEIFGFDFLILDDATGASHTPHGQDYVEYNLDSADAEIASAPRVQLKLLEVNSGPALEGSCCADVCCDVVEDTVALVLDRLRPQPPSLDEVISSMDDDESDSDETNDESAQANVHDSGGAWAWPQPTNGYERVWEGNPRHLRMPATCERDATLSPSSVELPTSKPDGLNHEASGLGEPVAVTAKLRERVASQLAGVMMASAKRRYLRSLNHQPACKHTAPSPDTGVTTAHIQ